MTTLIRCADDTPAWDRFHVWCRIPGWLLWHCVGLTTLPGVSAYRREHPDLDVTYTHSDDYPQD